jgi:molybdate transport system regulatory protein
MKISARNQFPGKVVTIRPDAVNDDIEMQIEGGQRLAAIITHDSTEWLRLAVGADVVALIKASSILLMTDDRGMRLSARNRLAGEVIRIEPGSVNTEVLVRVAAGPVVTAIVTNASVVELGLAVGAAVTAVFKASSVILATHG